jgi:hypothetical protein
MYPITDQQIDFILRDLKGRGVELEDLQLNLLDHVCCIVEQELDPGGDFESFYQKVIPRFFKKELKEIEEETRYLLTFKHYYAMKKTMMISGTISISLFIIGSFFKMMHWPGANIMIVSGTAIFSFLFLPLIFLLKTRDAGPKRDKLITAIGSLVGMLLCMAVLFAVMHWPGAGNGIFWLSAIAVSVFVLIPVYFFTGIRNPDTRINTIVTSIVLVGASCLLFAMVNVRPSLRLTQIKMYNYIQSEALLDKMQANMVTGNKLITEMNAQCEEIKALILQSSIGERAIPPDFDKKDMLMEEGNLGADFFDNGKGIQLLKMLKGEMISFNNLPELNAGSKVPVDHSILDIDFDLIGRYSNYTVLNGINQLQMYLVVSGVK